MRLRELRLVQKIYAEEKKEAAEAVKPKVKQKTKRKSAFEIRDRDLDSKASKDRRKSGVKEKKKVRDDFPDLADAEQKYFEIVEQVRGWGSMFVTLARTKEINQYQISRLSRILEVLFLRGFSEAPRSDFQEMFSEIMCNMMDFECGVKMTKLG